MDGSSTRLTVGSRLIHADLKNIEEIGIPYGNRTRVALVKEKRFIGIQRGTFGMDSTVR